LNMIGQALHFSRHAIAATGKAVSNNRRLDIEWEQVAVQAICPPPSGGFHLVDGERDPAIPMDSPVTECAAVLVPRQVTGGPARNTRSSARRARVIADAHVVATPVVNDNIDEGVDPNWNGINESDWNGINEEDWNGINLDGVDMPIEGVDPNDIFEPRSKARSGVVSRVLEYWSGTNTNFSNFFWRQKLSIRTRIHLKTHIRNLLRRWLCIAVRSSSNRRVDGLHLV
jgi:hypothetical protein